MPTALTLRSALTRGAVVAWANWPVVLVEFVAESLYKFALAVPVMGGAFMLAVLLDADMGSMLGEGVLAAVEHMLVPMTYAPAALAAFLAAMAVVGSGGAAIMFVVKMGALAILADGERRAGEFDGRPFGPLLAREARAFSLAALRDAVGRFQRRAFGLGLALAGVYIVIAGAYVFAIVYGFTWLAESAWSSIWPLVVLVATSGGVIAMTAANLLFDVMRVVIVTDDCSLRVAFRRVRTFLLVDARHVLGIFGAMGGLVLLATVASITATAGLTLVAWVPIAGLLFVPLQIAVWIGRGLLFGFMSLTTLSAYQTQYRRFAAPRVAPFRLQVHG